MPHQTFANLPPERRAEIVSISLAEFTAHEYESASLSKIMDEVGVTRGAFYRYFEGKEALYRYLIDLCLEEKQRFVEKHLDLGSRDFFAILRQGMECHLAFHLEHPDRVAFLLSAHRNGDVKPEQFFLIADGARTFSDGVRFAQRAGAINSDFDPAFLGYLISRVMVDLAPYIQEHCGAKGRSQANPNPEKVRRIFDQTILMLRRGVER